MYPVKRRKMQRNKEARSVKMNFTVLSTLLWFCSFLGYKHSRHTQSFGEAIAVEPTLWTDESADVSFGRDISFVLWEF